MTRIGTVSLLAATVALGAAAIPASAVDSDADFVKKAAAAGMTEVELGKHAAAHAASQDVRAFGKQMAADHAKADTELKAVAKSQGLAVPSQLPADKRKDVDALAKMTGAEFDKAYMDDMVSDHEDVVDAFREQAKEGKTAVDKWAAKTLPTLESHLAHAKPIDQKLEDQGGQAGRSGSPSGPAPVGTQPRGMGDEPSTQTP
jgi:putative membrane protein